MPQLAGTPCGHAVVLSPLPEEHFVFQQALCDLSNVSGVRGVSDMLSKKDQEKRRVTTDHLSNSPMC